MRISASILILFSCWLGATIGCQNVVADPVVLYSTGFESSEGFDSAYELAGQGGWTGFPYYTDSSAVNASGIISNQVPGGQQEAYVGFFEPNPTRDFVSVWAPVNFEPAQLPIVQFDVTMTVFASSSEYPNPDNFYWSVYNMDGQRLFTVDFDNYYMDISYFLDGESGLIETGQSFTSDVQFRFSITMNFQANQWSAAIEGQEFISNAPITTTNASLNLGDVDAGWAIYDPAFPGDNYMAFDDYRLTAEAAATWAWLESLGFLNGEFVLRIHGSEGTRHCVDASTDMAEWTSLKTNTVSGGFFDFIDQSAAAHPLRFYRSRRVP